jgi:hypothetical protein
MRKLCGLKENHVPVLLCDVFENSQAAHTENTAPVLLAMYVLQA